MVETHWIRALLAEMAQSDSIGLSSEGSRDRFGEASLCSHCQALLIPREVSLRAALLSLTVRKQKNGDRRLWSHASFTFSLTSYFARTEVVAVSPRPHHLPRRREHPLDLREHLWL